MLDKLLNFIAKCMTSGENYIEIGNFLIQWGTASKTVGANTGENTQITFGKSYKNTPVVFAQATNTTNFPNLWTAGACVITTDGFRLTFHNQYSSQMTIPCNWIAFGISS